MPTNKMNGEINKSDDVEEREARKHHVNLKKAINALHNLHDSKDLKVSANIFCKPNVGEDQHKEVWNEVNVCLA